MNTNTSLTPTYKVFLSNDGVNLNIIETTSTYDINTNKGGYGTVNPETSDVSLVSLTINTKNGDYTFTNGSGGLLENLLPDDTITNIAQIPSDQLGYVTGSQIGDQLLTLVFTSTGTFNAVTFITETTIYYGSNAQLLCCLDKARNLVDTVCCDQEDIYADAVNQLEATISAYQYAASCNDVDRANDLYAQAAQLCKFCNCSCS